MSTKDNISKDNFFDQDTMKNARSGAQYWYEEIWQNVGKCVFCDLKEKYIIHEKDGVVLTTNLFPYIDGQMMIIPRRHVNSAKELTKDEWETIRIYSYIGKKIMRKAHKYKNMWHLLREGGPTAQKTVTDHLHVQLIPFDKSDLAKWNYRKLKYSPIENSQKYQELNKYIDKKLENFEKSYSIKTMAPVIAADALIVNKKGELLLGQKKEEFSKPGNPWILPGGRIDPEESIEEGLIREIKEETNVSVKEKDILLLKSRLTDTEFEKVNRVHKERFLLNTYLVKLDRNPRVSPGDDIGKLKWVDIEDVKKLNTVFEKELLKHLP